MPMFLPKKTLDCLNGAELKVIDRKVISLIKIGYSLREAMEYVYLPVYSQSVIIAYRNYLNAKAYPCSEHPGHQAFKNYINFYERYNLN